MNMPEERAEILRQSNLKRYGILLILAIVVVSGVLFWFVNSLQKEVYETQLTNMDELASHDINTIQNFIDDYWADLQGTASKVALEQPADDAAISEALRHEKLLSEFTDIYLVDAENNLYSTTGISKADAATMQKDYLSAEQVMTRPDPMTGSASSRDEYLFSGKKLYGVSIAGHQMVEIIGKCDLNKIQNRIRISNYDGKGYSSVFDHDGAMIIGINAQGQHVTNYYDFLKTSTDLPQSDIDEIQNEIANGNSFTRTITEKYSGQTSIVSFQPIEGIDWYFLISVPKSVFDQQNQAMLTLVFAMVVIVLAAIIALLAWMFRGRIREREQAEREKQREALEEALDQAQAASRAKTAFLFNMSHDIRTPMNAVISLSDLAQNHLDDKETTRSYLDQISVAGKQLLALINNILEISRIESNKVELDEQVVDTEEVFDSIQTVFMNQQRAKNLDISFVQDLKHRWLYMDRTHLEEVLLNLISNAMKYTPDGGRVDIRLTELSDSDDKTALVRFEVKDNGIGMSEEYQAKMFQEFERERSSTVSGIQGTGLGLSIVNKLVAKMNGTIAVESAQGVGTTMVVEIPFKVAKAPEQSSKTSEVDDMSIFQGKRVLLAEDIDVNAMIATEILKMWGIEVERAHDGRECVDMLAAADADYYDMILMDIQMPNMDGYQATREIRSLGEIAKASIPVVAMTANAFKEDRVKVLDAGMNGHVAKPIDVPQMLTTVKRILEFKEYYVDSSDLNAFKTEYSARGCACGYFIYRDNEDEAIVYADPALAMIYGCDTEDEFLELAGGTFRGMVHPDDLISIEQAIEQQQFESSSSINNIEYRIVCKDGSVRTVRDIGYRAFNGREMLFYVYVADVTDLAE